MSSGSYYGPMLVRRYPCRMGSISRKEKMGHSGDVPFYFIYFYSTPLYCTPLHSIAFHFYFLLSSLRGRYSLTLEVKVARSFSQTPLQLGCRLVT